MEKIYGYKEKDIIGLAEFLKEKGNLSLTEIFERYSKFSGKAKGTVRNLYYALAKASQKDQSIRDKYLGGKALEVNCIVTFDEKDERQLVKDVLIGKSKGKSVRSVIAEMANGDAKLSLRYQNKYRGVIKNRPEWFCEMLKELNVTDTVRPAVEYAEKSPAELISEIQFKRLKTEINSLVLRVSSKECKENAYLKQRLSILERENLRLKTALYGDSDKSATIEFFSKRNRNGNGFGSGENGLN